MHFIVTRYRIEPIDREPFKGTVLQLLITQLRLKSICRLAKFLCTAVSDPSELGSREVLFSVSDTLYPEP